MKRLYLACLLIILAGFAGAQDLPPGPLAAPPFSTKIWDDPSLSNLSSKGHKALGYATVTLGATSLTLGLSGHPVPLVTDAAAVTAGLTVAAGLVAHWGQLSFEGDLATWHNLHAVAAVTGASLVAGSPFWGPRDRPSPWLAAGTGLLVLAIILEG